MSNTDNDWFYSGEEFQLYFKSSCRSLVMKANPPHFTMLAVSDNYLALVHKQRSELLGNNLFEVFPGNAADPSEKNSVFSSFNRVIANKQKDVLPIFKYEIFIQETGKLSTEYWSNINEPILDKAGNVAYLINTTANVTQEILTQQALEEADKQQEALLREQTLNEELAASNEELNSINEELYQVQEDLYKLNAELEERVAARTKALEESEHILRALNEELTAINEEQSSINQELLKTYSELQFETTAKQIAINRLEANEANIRNMVRQAPVGMCIVQGDPLFIVETNDIFLEIIGKRRERFYDTPYWDVNAEAKAYYQPITDDVLKTGNTYHANEHEIVLIRNGKPETVHVNFVYEPMKDEQGTSYAIMIVVIDITEQVNARKKTEQAEESLRIATESAELGTWYLHSQTLDFIVSPRFKQIFEFELNETLSYEKAFTRIHPDYQQFVTDAVQDSLIKEVPFNVSYPLLNNQNGKEKWIRSIGKSIHSEDGSGVYITGVIADITEQKLDEQRKNDFIGMVSHELKTPLTSMSGYLQLLQLKAKNSEDGFTASMLDKASKQVSKMTTLVNGFLNVSRLEAGKIQIDKHRFNMADLVKEAEEEALSIITSHHVIFKPVEPIFVNADRDKISQVISNLISNAEKYSPANTTIQVACIMVNGMAQVSVKDEGIGIQPEDKDKLFERYYRVKNNNTQSVSGFGIGLYLCAEIIQRHDGKIWVESEWGKGSTFYFSLPVLV